MLLLAVIHAAIIRVFALAAAHMLRIAGCSPCPYSYEYSRTRENMRGTAVHKG